MHVVLENISTTPNRLSWHTSEYLQLPPAQLLQCRMTRDILESIRPIRRTVAMKTRETLSQNLTGRQHSQHNTVVMSYQYPGNIITILNQEISTLNTILYLWYMSVGLIQAPIQLHWVSWDDSIYPLSTGNAFWPEPETEPMKFVMRVSSHMRWWDMLWCRFWRFSSYYTCKPSPPFASHLSNGAPILGELKPTHFCENWNKITFIIFLPT